MNENPLRGIVLMVAATIFFSLSDAMAKHLVGHLPAIEIAWIRYVVFTLIGTMPLLRNRRASMRTRRPGYQVARGLGIVASALCFIFGLSSLPLAEAAAVSFASPCSSPFWQFHSSARWSGCAAGPRSSRASWAC